MKTKTSPVANSMNRSSLWRGFVLIAVSLGSSFAWALAARADCREGCDLAHANTFLGNDALISNTFGFSNTAIGFGALYSNDTGDYNTANGGSALYANTAGEYNTATGFAALVRNTTGSDNTANGVEALFHNIVGDNNTANGAFALFSNTSGSNNTANGVEALYWNETGHHNTANGFRALYSNTTGYYNTANGNAALYSNTTGHNNTVTGLNALFSNTTGFYNTVNGVSALFYNTTGSSNTANGYAALYSNTTGNRNTAYGINSLYNNTIGSLNAALGYQAGLSLTSGSGNVCIGAGVSGVAGESNTSRVRNVYASLASGRAVYVNSDNKIGTLTSSRRFKEEIRPMEKASESILALQPVTFRYKKQIDASGTKQFGLVAEEVEKVNPDLVTCDEEGKPESVRYEAINAMLLNEFLKEHRKNEEQEATIARQQKQIEALAAGLQRVSAQLELSKPAPRTVLNDH